VPWDTSKQQSQIIAILYLSSGSLISIFWLFL